MTRAFFALWVKKTVHPVLLSLGHFRCSAVTSVTFCSNLGNFEEEKNPKKKLPQILFLLLYLKKKKKIAKKKLKKNYIYIYKNPLKKNLNVNKNVIN